MTTKLLPGTVAVYQPAFNVYRVMFTGGAEDAMLWILGDWEGQRSLPSLPAGATKVAKGVWGLP